MLSLTTPIAGPPIDSLVISRVLWDVEADQVTITYNRMAGSTLVDHSQVTLPPSAIAQAAGGGMKAKAYNALATALGVGYAGTVT